MSSAGLSVPSPSARVSGRWRHARRLPSALRSSAPVLLFGLRLWAAVCLALYIAFWLELDNPYWAVRGDRLSAKPWRLTAQGLVSHGRHCDRRGGYLASDCVLSAKRDGFLFGLALWGAA